MAEEKAPIVVKVEFDETPTPTIPTIRIEDEKKAIIANEVTDEATKLLTPRPKSPPPVHEKKPVNSSYESFAPERKRRSVCEIATGQFAKAAITTGIGGTTTLLTTSAFSLFAPMRESICPNFNMTDAAFFVAEKAIINFRDALCQNPLSLLVGLSVGGLVMYIVHESIDACSSQKDESYSYRQIQ